MSTKLWVLLFVIIISMSSMIFFSHNLLTVNSSTNQLYNQDSNPPNDIILQCDEKNHYYINSSKWSNCFKIDNYIIHQKYDLKYLDILINDFICRDKLVIYALSYMRLPIFQQHQCGIPMISVQVSQQYYFISDENKFIFRNHSRQKPYYKEQCLNDKEICLYRDIHFLYKLIYGKYANSAAIHSKMEWVLILEDDILLCGYSMELIYNIITQNDHGINVLYLGHGATGILVRFSFIPEILKVLDGYLPLIWRIKNGTTGNIPMYDKQGRFRGMMNMKAVDRYIPSQWMLMHNETFPHTQPFYGSLNTSTYHFRQAKHQGDMVLSTMDHGFHSELKCHERPH